MKPAASLVIALSLIAIPFRTAAQTTEPDLPPAPEALAPPTPPDFDRPVSWKLLLPNIASDQGHIWSFPVRLIQGHDLIPTAAVLGTTAALITLDPTEASYFHGSSTFRSFNNVFTGSATVYGTVAVPVSLYAIGLFRKDTKMQHTALLAGEAVADAEILTAVLKNATMRVRPASFQPGGNYSDSWFENPGSRFKSAGSFPSGHSIAAFSVATIIARRYRNHRWVPFAAYGMAGLVGFSRLSLSAHFLSDVFVGGTLGYTISRYSVLRQ